MYINFNAKDPNIKDFTNAVNLAAKSGANIITNWTHLKPTKVIKDTAKQYVAKYRDNHGSYIFKIERKGNTYTVISDGHLVMSGVSRDRVVWEFENQINSNPVKCL
jgi:hypothetical protein